MREWLGFNLQSFLRPSAVVAALIGAPVYAAIPDDGSLAQGLNIAQSSLTLLAQQMIPLRFQSLDLTPYADAAVRPLRTLGVLSELQPVAVFNLTSTMTLQICLGTKSSAGFAGLKIKL